MKEIKSSLNLDETISETSIYNIVHENARDEEEINALDSEEVFLPIDEGDTPMVDDMVSPPPTNLEPEIQTNMKLEVEDIVTVMEVEVQDIETIEGFHASPASVDSEKHIVVSAIETDGECIRRSSTQHD